MKQARLRMPSLNRRQAQRGAAVAYYRHLMQLKMPPELEANSTCEHDFVLEGQTLAGNVWSCSKCKKLRFSEIN